MVNGNKTDDYKKLVNKYNLEKNIIFLGLKKNPYPYFKISDCLILTSDYEGYPVVFNEAKILDLPIITTNISDAQIDISNKYGIITENSINSIYKSMLHFIKNGYSIKEKFDASEYNKNILDKLRGLINE